MVFADRLCVPLLGFTVDGDVWGFCNEDEFTVCGPRTIAEDLPSGMDLFRRRWPRLAGVVH